MKNEKNLHTVHRGIFESHTQTILGHAARQGTAALTHCNQLCEQYINFSLSYRQDIVYIIRVDRVHLTCRHRIDTYM